MNSFNACSKYKNTMALMQEPLVPTDLIRTYKWLRPCVKSHRLSLTHVLPHPFISCYSQTGGSDIGAPKIVCVTVAKAFADVVTLGRSKCYVWIPKDRFIPCQQLARAIGFQSVSSWNHLYFFFPFLRLENCLICPRCMKWRVKETLLHSPALLGLAVICI